MEGPFIKSGQNFFVFKNDPISIVQRVRCQWGAFWSFLATGGPLGRPVWVKMDTFGDFYGAKSESNTPKPPRNVSKLNQALIGVGVNTFTIDPVHRGTLQRPKSGFFGRFRAFLGPKNCAIPRNCCSPWFHIRLLCSCQKPDCLVQKWGLLIWRTSENLSKCSQPKIVNFAMEGSFIKSGQIFFCLQNDPISIVQRVRCQWGAFWSFLATGGPLGGLSEWKWTDFETFRGQNLRCADFRSLLGWGTTFDLLKAEFSETH